MVDKEQMSSLHAPKYVSEARNGLQGSLVTNKGSTYKANVEYL